MTFKHQAQGDMSKQDAPLGYCLLSRDHATWGDEGTGSDAIDAEGECDQGRCPHYNHMEHDSMHDTIHLHIAAFRDRLCPRTLHNLFQKAANPKRIYVRLIQQVEHDSDKVDDADCWDMFCKTYGSCEEYKDQVQVLTMNAKIAMGPTDPRSKLTALVEYDYLHTPVLHAVHPQDYCMQTDSHMDFSQNFDVMLIDMFHRTRNDYAVLSTYVAPMSQTDTFPKEVPHLCMVEFTETWRNWGTKFCQDLQRPKLTNLPWGAGLSFSKCHADLNVPYDPYLPNIFDGEEVSRAFRYFTHGYDVYTPDQVLVTHDYDGHQHNPNVHTWGQGGGASGGAAAVTNAANQDTDMTYFMKDILDMQDLVKPKGIQRINVLLGFIQNASLFEIISHTKYGHGDRRTLQQAIEFSGFDPHQKKMVRNRCGNIKWIPFEEADDNFGLDHNVHRRLWSEGDSSSSAVSSSSSAAAKRRTSTTGSRRRPNPLPPPVRRVGGGSLSQESQPVQLPNLQKTTVRIRNNSSSSSTTMMVLVLLVMVIGGIYYRKRLYHECYKAKKTERMVA